MTFVYSSGTLDATGNLSPDSISGNLEQYGSILRTITGRGVSNRVWSKMAFSFSWNQVDDEVSTKLKAMVSDTGNIAFTDTTIGNFNFVLTDDSLSIGETAFGISTASALFREV